MTDKPIDPAEEAMIERINHRSKLYAKLSEAQSKFPPIVKDTINKFFNSNYVTLDGLIELTRDVLREVGLVCYHELECSDGTVVHCSAVLADIETGYIIHSSITIPLDKPTAQAAGSAVTYARRYTLASLLGIAPEEDDDGNKASGRDASKSKSNEPKGGRYPKEKTESLDDVYRKQAAAYLKEIGMSQKEQAEFVEICKQKGVKPITIALDAKNQGFKTPIDVIGYISGFSDKDAEMANTFEDE